MSNETQINVINNAGTSRIPFFFQWNQESLHLFAKETLPSLFPSRNFCAKFLLNCLCSLETLLKELTLLKASPKGNAKPLQANAIYFGRMQKRYTF